MSSPRSALSSAAVTRQHTPGDNSVNSQSDDEESPEEQLPERLRFLLSQSTIYSSIIAGQLARATEERQKKDDRVARRKELKDERGKQTQQSRTTTRQTRRGIVKPTNVKKVATPASSTKRKKVKDHDSSDDDEEVIVTSRRSSEAEDSLLSSQSESEDGNKVKVHDFEKDKTKVGAATTRRSSRKTTSHRRANTEEKGVAANGKTKNGKKSGNVKNEESSSDDNININGNGNGVLSSDEEEDDAQEQGEENKAPLPEASEDVDPSRQPPAVTGATMKSYQVAGMEWLISLYENGLNGILADEMGLGKTLQTIAFLAHLKQQGIWGPFLICCPLSTLANWVNEFERFTPSIPVVLYHGTPQERADIRETRLSLPMEDKPSKGKNGSAKKKARKSYDYDFENTKDTFPIVVTSYELVMNDRKYLANYKWKYLVVDESHRLKNLNCKLIRELMSYQSANRLLLTGTPLQNNLDELWSLLNFLMPDIFDDLDAFKSWFDIDVTLDDSATHQVVTKLHAILKPFLLRRVKRDVAKSLPPKKEYLLSAPLTVEQKQLYDAVVNKQIRDFLLARDGKTIGDAPSTSDDEVALAITKKTKNGKVKSPAKGKKSPKTKTNQPTTNERASRRSRPTSYLDDSSADEDWLDDLDDGTAREKAEAFERQRFGKARLDMVSTAVDSDDDDPEIKYGKQATAKIRSLKLSNMVMQLRKVVNHPWLFEWPMNPKTGEYILDDRIVTSSGKMMLLDRLLAKLFATGHKVLVYSQFTTQLDIIEDWAVEWKGWKICRIDGRTPQEDRRSQLKDFNEKKGKNAPNLFLLSTRSGGVGINLTGADTVILFDSDWNPQMDLQAMDRVHRLGQTKPVLIFRLVTANTIEAKMLEKAGKKRKLEALVIGSGKYTASLDDLQDIFKGNASGGSNKGAGFAARMFAEEMQDQAARKDANGDATGKEMRVIQEGEEVIPEKQLDLLLDRSDEAMQRGKGWKAGSPAGKKSSSKAFEVIETVAAGDETEEDDQEMAEMFKHGSRQGSPEND